MIIYRIVPSCIIFLHRHDDAIFIRFMTWLKVHSCIIIIIFFQWKNLTWDCYGKKILRETFVNTPTLNKIMIILVLVVKIVHCKKLFDCSLYI